ncbi:hypothetical protein B0T22DRAFT_455037 [Podospora appendiculata]|uniref:Uncharacterized protein n=1 Tax=Podospora appendiculata TaxID=314037 RepID=A0AAE0XKX1_9PEZI|nr:hypothetical protein B0T22DRAFT_455037 [Podospora appendiculata]
MEECNVPFQFSPLDQSGNPTPASFQNKLPPADNVKDPVCGEDATCGQENNLDTVSKNTKEKGEIRDWTHVALPYSPSGPFTSQQEHEESEYIAVSGSCEDRKVTSGAKLKLKVSRGAMSKTREEPGTLRRKMVNGTSEFWEDSSEPWEHASHDGNSPVSAHVDARFGSAKFEMCDQEHAFICSPTPSTPVATLSTPHEARCVEEEFPATQTSMSSVSQAPPSVIQSSFSDDSAAGIRPSRGLRKRVSDLRVRLAESRLRAAEPQSPMDGPRTNPESVAPASVAKSTETKEYLVPSKSPAGSENAPTIRTRGFRGRMSRWMKSARQAVISRKRG